MRWLYELLMFGVVCPLSMPEESSIVFDVTDWLLELIDSLLSMDLSFDAREGELSNILRSETL